jgi:glycosyltransferase involved in cell wall biosynthesis
LTLIGDGEHLPQVRQALCTNGGTAHFIGHLLGDDLADAYAAADVFVFPAVRETFGQVILEAMGAACQSSQLIKAARQRWCSTARQVSSSLRTTRRHFMSEHANCSLTQPCARG